MRIAQRDCFVEDLLLEWRGTVERAVGCYKELTFFVHTSHEHRKASKCKSSL